MRTHSFTSKPLQSQSESAFGQTGKQIDKETGRRTDRQSVVQTKHGRKAQSQWQASIYEASIVMKRVFMTQTHTHTIVYIYIYSCFAQVCLLKGTSTR